MCDITQKGRKHKMKSRKAKNVFTSVGASKESIFTFEMAGILVLILLINISNGRKDSLRDSKNYNFDQELKQYCMYYKRQFLLYK